MELDPKERTRLAEWIVSVLEEAVVGSKAKLRGSLAQGNADLYSDVDVVWVVPDAQFGESLRQLPDVIGALGEVESLRYDPALQKSARRRLVFVRFEGVPLFWRVDLDVRAASVGDDADYDLDNPDARGDRWSKTESAMMNAVGAIKACLRGKADDAEGLIERGFERIGCQAPEADLKKRILRLVEEAVREDPTREDLGRRITLLIDRYL